jgi:hypothetical protein
MSTNVLLERLKLPGEIVKLPSGGLFYDEGILAPEVEDGEVMVHPMSAYDDICMKNLSEIINGKSINTVFARCIPQILKPAELFGKDVDQLLLMLRKVTYGPTLEISYKHTCEEAENHRYSVQLSQMIGSSKAIDPTVLDSQYTVMLDNGQVVTLQPMKFCDVLEIMKDASDFQTINSHEMQDRMMRSTVKMIKAVDEVTDFDLIDEWVHQLPNNEFKKITEAMNNNNDWGPVTTTSITCQDCGEELVVDVPLNPLTFFLDS